MPVVNAKEIMIEAAKGRYAIAAFHVTNLIQTEGVIDAAVDKKSPVVLQVSVDSSKFLGADVIAAIYRTIASTTPIPICLDLDHCPEIDFCKKCADLGYTNIMMDASEQRFQENIQRTCEVVEYCHKAGNISVEGKLGKVGGVEHEAQLADPRQSVEFVEKTGLDIFAPAIVAMHGSDKTTNPEIDVPRLMQINQLLNGNGLKTPLAAHLGTGLPQDTIKRLIEAGAARFDVSTELKRTMIDAQYDYLTAKRQEYEPGKIDIAVRDAIRKAAGHWIQMLGSGGKV